MAPFEVVEYNADTLLRLLAELPNALPEVAAKKLHSVYFQDYFGKLSARTIVVESEYVDRDYLEDFAAYYVRCFGDYKRKCARLHFFNAAFTKDQFQSVLQRQPGGLSETKLQEHYLGFVVIKPLPRTVIGRSCLRTYDTKDIGSNHTRHFPTTRLYRANLFGIQLAVNTVAFQEQDSVVAACATSALWSAFQCTARLFDHSIPSPVEITKSASTGAPLDTRALPNAGLTSPQMAEAIRCLPLEPYLVSAKDPDVLRSSVYAYLKAGVPVLLTIELRGLRGSEEKVQGYHAVAVTGFSLGDSSTRFGSKAGMQLVSDRLMKIYAHDDQVGPFARMEIDKSEIDRYTDRTWDEPEWAASLKTSWGIVWEQFDKVNAAPINMLVPLYHKIRIPFDFIHGTLVYLDELLESIRLDGALKLGERITWDIHLTTVNDFKRELRSADGLTALMRQRLLTEHLPRFIWRAKAVDGGRPLVDLLFDATDMEQGHLFLRPVVYDDPFGESMRILSSSESIRHQFRLSPIDQIFERFRSTDS